MNRLATWQKSDNPELISLHSGEVAAYDLIIDLLKDATNHWNE
jgi:hypothetical protein